MAKFVFLSLFLSIKWSCLSVFLGTYQDPKQNNKIKYYDRFLRLHYQSTAILDSPFWNIAKIGPNYLFWNAMKVPLNDFIQNMYQAPSSG